MISGPITPRTRMGLREFVRQRTQLLESGLVLVQEDLELGSNPGACATVDALARDALGIPLFVFAACEETARDLPTRILEVDGWFRRHGESLLRALADAGYKSGAAPRFLVVGFELVHDLLDRLERLSVQRLEAVQICSFGLQGELHYDIERVLPRGSAKAICEGVMPSIVDPKDKDLCACALDLMQRLDPRVAVTGDRFSRRFSLAGSPLGTLSYDENGLTFAVGDRNHRIQCWDHLVDAVDEVLRAWHLGCRESEALPDASDGPGQEGHQQAGPQQDRQLASGESVPSVRPLAKLEARISLDALRRSVASSKVTNDEYQALLSGESEAV